MWLGLPAEDLISGLFLCASNLSDANREPRSAPPYRRVHTLAGALENTHHLPLSHPHTRPPACLAVKWLCSGHAQFVSFHPGLMSDSTQGLSAPFEAPPPLGRGAAAPLVCFCSVLCGKMALSPNWCAVVCTCACVRALAAIHINKRQ